MAQHVAYWPQWMFDDEEHRKHHIGPEGKRFVYKNLEGKWAYFCMACGAMGAYTYDTAREAFDAAFHASKREAELGFFATD